MAEGRGEIEALAYHGGLAEVAVQIFHEKDRLARHGGDVVQALQRLLAVVDGVGQAVSMQPVRHRPHEERHPQVCGDLRQRRLQTVLLRRLDSDEWITRLDHQREVAERRHALRG